MGLHPDCFDESIGVDGRATRGPVTAWAATAHAAPPAPAVGAVGGFRPVEQISRRDVFLRRLLRVGTRGNSPPREKGGRLCLS
jgi:hypothetical protein